MNTVPASKDLEEELLTIEENHFADIKSAQIKPSKLQRTFVGFANSDGGDLYVGIEDKKMKGERIQGFPSPEAANDVIHVLLTETKPSVEGVEFSYLDFGERGLVLHFNIPKSPRVHYTSSDKCYTRTNARTDELKQDAVVRLSYAKGSYNYERVPLPHVEKSDMLQSSHLISYLKRVGTHQDAPTFLRKQRLWVNHESTLAPTVACVLLFDEVPQATLDTRCAIKVYRLHTADAEYRREHLQQEIPTTIEGPIEEQIHKVIYRVGELVRDVSYSVAGKLIKLSYPAEALREILVNAVIHRDYSVNDDIHVMLYDNRIEIKSPGKLPGYITVENILDERYSRNPNIVRMLNKLPDPVNYDIGEGLNTAFNAMRGAGLVYPEIIESENAVLVKVEHRRMASLEDIILEYLDEHEFVANRDIRQISGERSENKVKHAFQKLREQKLIEPVDPDARAFDYKYRKVRK